MIFDHQRTVMQKFHAIEEANGFPRGLIHLSLEDPIDQSRIREQAWNAIEELGEVLDTPEGRFEELADVMHFLVELMVLADCGPERLVIIRPMPKDALDYLYEEAERAWPPGFANPDDDVIKLSFVFSLARAIHELKNKPWKQTRRPTDLARFYLLLRVALVDFFAICLSQGLSAHELFEYYVRKNQANHQRVAQGV